MNPDWTFLALSVLFLSMAVSAELEQQTIRKTLALMKDMRAEVKVRWRLATISKAQADMLYRLADEAWVECGESADPRIGSGLRSPVEKYRYHVQRYPEVVDEAIERLRAVAS